MLQTKITHAFIEKARVLSYAEEDFYDVA